MIYVKSIMTPKNTALTSLYKSTIRLTGGLVYKVEFYFPPGPSGLVGVAVFDGLFQVWPSSPGQFLVSDDETVEFDDLYLKDQPPFEFQIYTYNVDTAYDHTIDFRIGLVSQEIFMARFLPFKGYDYLTKLLEDLRAQREEVAAMQAELATETPFEWLLRQEGALD